ncbi:MAG: hypothetical protein RMK91_02955 [Pseudanabaenaceae cyanobacterium SKYGB_i_bin29]|nr:hypothetical protein [Pseudanabaenaceae cyanobacterium SKYG29]MDW8420803.1 hypothetical protein [Pseudanabaenaceae cyanobacterium SKYGB_i_bin29]
MLKKVVLVSTASIGTFTLCALASRSVQAQSYVSGSVTLTNITGASTSLGAEIGGVQANGVIVQPNYNLGPFFGVNSFVNNLTLNAIVNASAAPISVSQVVAQNLSAIAGPGAANILGSTNQPNLAAYVAIVRAAAGNDGLE